MKVGLVGCGNIGADLCIALQKGTIPARIAALTDIDRSRAALLRTMFRLKAAICDLEANVAAVDFVVECASQDVVEAVVNTAINCRKSCLIMSVGGLMAHLELLERARESGIQVRVPSGALCGLDGIRAAVEGGLHSVTLTTRKPPKGLAGAPYLVERGIDVEALNEATVVFEGTALEAVRAFPANVNVAAALSLAGIGAKETTVRIVADPRSTVNRHEVVAEGAFGRLEAVTENMPSPRNPKSSYLASLSACAELRAAAMAFAGHE
jgi:aspartate dehydrogenase